jgi:hypothetical protein
VRFRQDSESGGGKYVTFRRPQREKYKPIFPYSFWFALGFIFIMLIFLLRRC